MGKAPILGTCHLCGSYTKLSFEHVPPKAAFNNRPVKRIIGDVLLRGRAALEDMENMKGRTQQLGAGDYTLCERCNNDTGAWYGNAFAEWTWQGARILSLTEGQPSLYYNFQIFPLRVIKQVLCMFFSANGEKFREAQPELVRLILNREGHYLKPGIRIFTFFNPAPVIRQTGVVGQMNVYTGRRTVMSEITFPPLGYLMTFNSEPPDERLIDISFFAEYRYNDWKEITLRIPALPVYTYLPGDYRPREAFQKFPSREERNE